MNKIYTLILTLLLITTPCLATDYYIKNGGNDGASGTSDANAWASIGKLEGSFSAGDTINLNRGDTFTVDLENDGYQGVEFKSSGSSGSPITIQPYGTGDNPIIDSIEEIDEDAYRCTSWADQGDNVWMMDCDGNIINRLFFTDSDLGWTRKETPDGSDETAIDGEQFLWYHDSSNGELFVYSVGNPDTYYDKIEGSRTNYNLYIDDEDYIDVKDIKFVGGAKGGIYIRGNSDNINIENPYVELFAGNGIKLYASGSTIDSVDIYGDATDTDEIGGDGTCVIDGNMNMLTLSGYIETDKVVEDGINYSVNVNNSSVKYCTISDVEHSLLTIQQGSSNNTWEYNILDGDYNDSKYVRGIDINGGTEGGANEADSNIVRFNLITDTNVRSQLGGTNNEYYNNQFLDVQQTQATDRSYRSAGVMFQTFSGCGGTCLATDNKFYNNTIYNTWDECVFVDWASSGNQIYNNILQNCGFGSGDGANLCIEVSTNASTSDNLYKNNLCQGDNETSNIKYKGTTYTIEQADAGCSGNCINEFENNIGADARLTDPHNDDITILESSPARNAGFDVSATLTTDYEGETRVPAPDIGADEYLISATATYYIDPTNGSDANDGSDCDNALKTISGAKTEGWGCSDMLIYCDGSYTTSESLTGLICTDGTEAIVRGESTYDTILDEFEVYNSEYIIIDTLAAEGGNDNITIGQPDSTVSCSNGSTSYITYKNSTSSGASGRNIVLQANENCTTDHVYITNVETYGSTGNHNIKANSWQGVHTDGCDTYCGSYIYFTDVESYEAYMNGLQVSNDWDYAYVDGGKYYDNSTEGKYQSRAGIRFGTTTHGEIKDAEVYTDTSGSYPRYQMGIIIDSGASDIDIHGVKSYDNYYNYMIGLNSPDVSDIDLWSSLSYGADSTKAGIYARYTDDLDIDHVSSYGETALMVKSDAEGVVMKNSICSAVNETCVDVEGSDTTLDYNQYYRSDSTANTLIDYNSTTYATTAFATYQSAQSQDANSSTGDPKYTSPSSDLTLQETSPTLNAGTYFSTTKTKDITGEYRRGADLGAYSYSKGGIM